MSILQVSRPSPGVFLLSGELNRLNVNNSWPKRIEDIKEAASEQPPVLDLKQVTHVDTAGLAWLINLLRDCLAQNARFTITNVPQTLINLAKISDVEGLLPLQ